MGNVGISRPIALSLVVLGLYVVLDFLGASDLLVDPQHITMILLGLGCIWLGNKKGGRRKIIPGIQVCPPSSGFMLRFTGWVFLILPFVLWLLSHLWPQ